MDVEYNDFLKGHFIIIFQIIQHIYDKWFSTSKERFWVIIRGLFLIIHSAQWGETMKKALSWIMFCLVEAISIMMTFVLSTGTKHRLKNLMVMYQRNCLGWICLTCSEVFTRVWAQPTSCFSYFLTKCVFHHLLINMCQHPRTQIIYTVISNRLFIINTDKPNINL